MYGGTGASHMGLAVKALRNGAKFNGMQGRSWVQAIDFRLSLLLGFIFITGEFQALLVPKSFGKCKCYVRLMKNNILSKQCPYNAIWNRLKGRKFGTKILEKLCSSEITSS